MSSEDPKSIFRTHSQYIHAFALLCRTPYTRGRVADAPDWARDLKLLTDEFKAVFTSPVNSTPRLSQVRASLRNAWGTELLLGLSGEIASEDELMRLTNNWAVVQAYYCTYHATQALLGAIGRQRPTSHPATQRQFADLWADQNIDLPPWSLGAIDGAFRNAPTGIDDSIHPWTACSPATCWDLAGKALRTTRNEAVVDSKSQKRDQKRRDLRRAWRDTEKERLAKGRQPRREPTFPKPRLTPTEHRRVKGQVRTHTVIDYLYRLRLKTNYKDPEMFTDGPDDDNISRVVNRDLHFLSSSTLLVHELRIRQYVGKVTLMEWVDDWLRHGPARSGIGLAQRRALLVA
jgi:hypothetical protein